MRTIILAALAALTLSGTAEAKPANCYNSDDGRYPCDFEQFGGDGSFVIRAPGFPTYTISMVGRDVADGFVQYERDARSVFLPGPFYRSNADRACWISEATRFRVCAY